MESPQSVESPFKTSMIAAKPDKNSNYTTLSNGIGTKPKEGLSTTDNNKNSIIGALEVYVHQARDIQNICIYHKQDVYAKLSLTNDPEKTAITKIINGGGRDPVFNDNLLLDVQTVDCSLKCEIYMMSRARNYLEDQLLGFSLVPLSEVLIENGKIKKEFSLSSTDLFHSPAGFVQLSLSYTGASPDVMEISSIPSKNVTAKDPDGLESITSELDRIEFPDPKTVKENQVMLSEYFGIPCLENVHTEGSESLTASDAAENGLSFQTCFPELNFLKVPEEAPKWVSPESSVSSVGVSSPVVVVVSDSSNAQVISKQSAGTKTDTSCEINEAMVKPVPTVNIEPEQNQNVVQQDIVDMYMKSMQQFTESLAKMKLPLDINSPLMSENSISSDQKLETPKNTGSRVFYGSRAFF